VLAGSLVLWTYFAGAHQIVEPSSQLPRHPQDIPKGVGIFLFGNWRAAMRKAARILPSVSRSSSSEESDSVQFISIALFSGVGLLISLVAVLMGVNGVW
jgi:hypothetical protein